MNIGGLYSELPKSVGDYRFAWVFSFLLATAFAPFIIIFKQSAPWLIVVPLAVGAVVIFAHEWMAVSKIDPSDAEHLVTVPAGYLGLKSYEDFFALEIKPKPREGKGQLPLFPGFIEATPAKSIHFIEDDTGRQIAVIPCDRYSALLITYLLDNLDKVTEKSLSAGLARFGKLGKGNSDIKMFVQDRAIREVIKSDFRGNLLSLVSKGGEKVVKDLLKAVEAKAQAERTLLGEAAETKQ